MKKLLLKAVACIVGVCSVMNLCGCNSKQTSTGDVKTANILMQSGHSKKFWEQKINDFNNGYGKEIGVNLVLTSKSDDAYNQALNVAIDSDQLPDFFMYGSLKKMVENNQIAALDELPDMDAFLNDYKDLLVQNTHTYNGKIYSIPSSLTTRGLIYNKDMFKAAGIVDENGEAKPPKTFDEVREYAKKLTNVDKNEYGIVFPVKWGAWVFSDVETLSQSTSGMPVYNPVDGVYDYTGCKPALDMIMGIKDDGSYYPGAEGLDNDPARARFAEGKIGMKIAFSFDVGVLNDQFPAKMDWGVAPLPVADENNCFKQQAQSSSSLQLSTKGLENLGAEKAALVFKWLYSKDTIRGLYKEGLEIPCNWDWVSDIEIDDVKTGWKEFCEMAQISAIRTTGDMPANTEGEKSFNEIVVNEVWTGKKSVDDALTEITDILNKGVEKYKKEYPDKDYTQYLEKDWLEKVKR